MKSNFAHLAKFDNKGNSDQLVDIFNLTPSLISEDNRNELNYISDSKS